MTNRKDIQRGQFLVADGGKAEITDRRDKIFKGARLTSTPNVSPIPLERKYPLMADVIKSAGPAGGPAFERENAAILELARRLQAVREQLQATRKRR